MAIRQNILVCVIVGLILLGVGQVSNAQGTDSQPSAKGVSTEDAAKLRQSLQTLGQAFGVEAEATPQKPTSETPKKTMAEVADKALDMVSSLTAQLDATLKKIAPDVWDIMLRQQYAKALAMPMFPVGILVVVWIYFRRVSEGWQPQTNDERGAKFALGKVIPIIIMIGYH